MKPKGCLKQQQARGNTDQRQGHGQPDDQRLAEGVEQEDDHQDHHAEIDGDDFGQLLALDQPSPRPRRPRQ